ncbi:uncharacterized protein A1O9_08794 [Exophiala aquamarina CBS 119918]|uniref:Transcription factor domain-containing protein n=1 Tax=Exophiala aquamarina CBS 119918 TaxID=1182545 RepID=A0A072P5L3_9EURO|nr:uncharacterized protein A1O9_08794 [Exophiala aquamarina CBS 119918]KEF55141.1 hypothetical protein A1O9_08794 [Exophiala aquamarina CBS 119918]
MQPNRSPSPANPVPQPQPSKDHHLTADVRELEKVSTSHPSNALANGPHDPVGQNSDRLVSYIWLPPRGEAEYLVERYLDGVSFIHHVVHPPRIREAVVKLYSDLDSEGQADLGTVTLLLSLLASVTYLLGPEECDIDQPPTLAGASEESLSWIRITLDVLEYSQRSNLGSIESLQAMIIVSFLIGNIEGASQRFRSMIAVASTLARELGLHRIDQGKNYWTTESPIRGMVDAEVGRRLWWYLAATDWYEDPLTVRVKTAKLVYRLLTRYSGPAAGAYTVHVSHMAVKKPQNIDDHDLLDDQIVRDKPSSVPSVMSYSLQRIRLAEICRNAVDHASLWSPELRGANYSNIVFIDTELTVFSNALPWFFAIDDEGSGRLSQLDFQQQTTIKVQRYLINTTLHTQRCILHLPYFAQSLETNVYAYSREVCLDAARSVVQAELLIERDMLPFTNLRLKLSASLYGLFIANIIFFLEACLHKASGWPCALRSTAIEAFRLLMQARGSSPMAARLWETMTHISEKNKVSLPLSQAPNSLMEYASNLVTDDSEDTSPSRGAIGAQQQNQLVSDDWGDINLSCDGQDTFDPLGWAASIGLVEE